ncbi:MAG: 4Fe-4S dicluster domain-containing protein [Candidatus Latescibacterota bacterium]|nr:MAG: 4Fe-4S dicluster domain-containing protein [Candidatus Latescibacterota bacterium]
MQKGFIFDINHCTGCSACRLACIIENDLEPGVAWREVHTFNPARIEGIPVFHHSLACNHCVDPPCLINCPASAYTKDQNTGAVTIDEDACIGCKYCSWACPFDAPKLNPSTGVMEKCTLCEDRIDHGLAPACVTLCPTGALGFGDVEPGSHQHELGFPRSGVDAAIEFVPLDSNRHIPERSIDSSQPPGGLVNSFEIDGVESKISLRSEWSLIVFSQVVAWLTGYILAVVVNKVPALPIVFAGLGIMGVVASALHLGKRKRAMRALVNWRRSWLTREVILTSLFLITGAVWLMIPGRGSVWGWVVVAVGFAGLFAMDRVYHVTGTEKLSLHSAQTIITGIYAGGVLGWSGGLLMAGAAAKLLLYGYRKHRRYNHGYDPRFGISALRIIMGLVAPVLFWLWQPGTIALAAIVFAAAGELIDRVEFYAELYVTTPRRQLTLDLEKTITRGV